MASTNLTDIAAQVQKYWSPVATKQLRESLLLGSIVNKDYSGEIRKGGDTVRVYSVAAPSATTKTVGTVDSNTFAPSAISTSYVDVKADKHVTAAFEFADEVELMSLIDRQNPEVMASLVFAVEKAVNTALYAALVPSAAAPDHVINGVTDMNSTQLLAVRKLAAQAKWDMSKGWFGLLDPSYYSDVLASQTLVSSDFGASDTPVIGGKLGLRRYGWQIAEDNSLAEDTAFFLCPDALLMVMAKEMAVKISDLHPAGKHGILMSVDLIFGVALGIEGAKKCIKVTAA
jgi:hypothetical protein